MGFEELGVDPLSVSKIWPDSTPWLHVPQCQQSV